VDIRLPLFIDENTEVPEGMKKELSGGAPRKFLPWLSLISAPAKPPAGMPYIHMDAMAFGMGCSCLQITFQAWNVEEASRVYDALVPIAPIMVSYKLHKTLVPRLTTSSP
jgi:glutamate--cysteine ligase catalytic subunit